MNNAKSRHSSRRMWFTLFLASLALPLVGHADDATPPPQRLPGMSQQIAVRKAADLKVTAPKGQSVAVLDQSAAANDPKMSKIQDHNNGWLQLSVDQIEGTAIKVKGKYFVPESTKARPDGIRMTLRKRLKTGLVILSEKTWKIAAADINKWVDFEVELPLKADDPQPDGQLSLLLSATPLAGPIYLDMVDVTDATDKALWPYPSFE